MINNYIICTATEEEATTWLEEQLKEFVIKKLTFTGELEKYISYFIKDNDVVIAGIKSCFYLEEVLFINLLFIDENYRHQGLGTTLLNKTEEESKMMGAKLVHLDTFFGTLENCPSKHKRFYMKKDL